MSQSHWELTKMVVTGVWAVIGPLVGVFIGGYIANRNHRKQWKADCEKEEYRELLNVLTDSFSEIVKYHSMFTRGYEEGIAHFKAKDQAMRVMHNRLFIVEALKEMKLYESWQSAVDKTDNGDTSTFGSDFAEIKKDIVRSARHIVE